MSRMIASATNGILHEAAQQIIQLQLPQRHSHPSNEDGIDLVQMDFWTAASLNSDNIQDFNIEEEMNTKNSSNWTPLMYAAYLGHRELCQLLIMKGASVDETNERNQTALMLAASCGAIDVVRILLDFSADFNHRDQFGRSSLHYAVKYYHAHAVQLLLERGADPNLPDYNDSTPVLAASENGDEKMLSYLLEYKGDPTQRNKQGQDAFAIATDKKILILLRRYRPEIEPSLLAVLHGLDLQKYARNLADNGIRTLDSLLRLSEKDMDEIGIGLLGPKRKLTNLIREMRDKKEMKISTVTIEHSAQPQPPTQQSMVAGSSQLQQKVDDLKKLGVEQRRELMEQKRLNALCRQMLTQILTNGRCSACAERTPRRGSIEELIRELDRMNARLGSFLI